MADLRSKYQCSSDTSAEIDTAVYKTGTRSLKFNATTSEALFHMPNMLSWYEGPLSVHMGFHIRQSGLEARTHADPIIGSWNNAGSQQVSLTQTAAGLPELRRSSTVVATGSSGFTAGVWHWLEVFWTNDNSGRGIVAIDDTTVIDFTGDLENIAEGMNQLRLEGIDGSTNTQNVDNLFCRISDIEESPPTFYGPCYIKHLVPDADGNYTAWSSTASPTLYTEIDDNPADSPETYISSSTNGQKASFSHTAANLDNPGDDVILAVSLEHQATHHAAGKGSVRAFTRIASTDYNATSNHGCPYGGYARKQYIWDNDPSASPASAWTESAVDNAEFGIEFVSS